MRTSYLLSFIALALGLPAAGASNHVAAPTATAPTTPAAVSVPFAPS
jgi:hypothetical protein